MNEQMYFLAPIDRKATQKRVEKALNTAKLYKKIGFVRREIKNTPSYEPRLHGPTNQTSDPVADVATWNIDQEQRIKDFSERVFKAVDALDAEQREIIIKRYLEVDIAADYVVWNEIGMSERTYYRKKSSAFYQLAFILGLEVLKERKKKVSV